MRYARVYWDDVKVGDELPALVRKVIQIRDGEAAA